jgi:hypothetical protein
MLNRKLKAIKTADNQLKTNKEKLKFYETQKENVEKVIAELTRKKSINIQSPNFNLDELKKNFEKFLDNNIKIVEQIQVIIDSEQEKKKQDKYKYYFDKDDSLQTIILKLNSIFGEHTGGYKKNKIKNTFIGGKPSSTNTINIKKEFEQYDKLINIMKLYKKKEENENNSNFKDKISKLLEEFNCCGTSNFSKLLNNTTIENESNDKSDSIIELITKYINDVQSKKDIQKIIFFRKVLQDSSHYKTENALNYFKDVQEMHKKLLTNINKYIRIIENEGEKKITNTIFKNKFKKEYEYLKKEIDKMQEKYKKLNTTVYNSKDTIYVYTYTDSIKFYFITLSLIELYLHNSTL